MEKTETGKFAGSLQLTIKDELTGLDFPVLVHYPTDIPSVKTALGPYTADLSTDAPVAAGNYPLVVISHGSGGSHLVYRTISTFLACNNYIVAIPEHPGNNRNNNELENTNENLRNRPRHISLTIDAVLSDPRFSSNLKPGKIALAGHSYGGYTALAAAGGIPHTRNRELIETSQDQRVKALVLLAPAAAFFFSDNALSRINVPVLLMMAEHDPYTPIWNADIIIKGVPDPCKVDYRIIKNAGHFCFLSPFPENMKKPGFLPATDPEGFDREQFHKELPLIILSFLEDQL
jgi:predicted dienelactone hydrolase